MKALFYISSFGLGAYLANIGHNLATVEFWVIVVLANVMVISSHKTND